MSKDEVHPTPAASPGSSETAAAQATPPAREALEARLRETTRLLGVARVVGSATDLPEPRRRVHPRRGGDAAPVRRGGAGTACRARRAGGWAPEQRAPPGGARGPGGPIACAIASHSGRLLVARRARGAGRDCPRGGRAGGG